MSLTNAISAICLQECCVSAMNNVTMFYLDGYEFFSIKPLLCLWWSNYICSQTVCSYCPNRY